MDDVMADPVLRAQYEGELSGYTAYSSPDMKLLWVTYTCRGGKVLNNALVHTTQTGEGEPGEENQWHAPVSRDQVLSRLEGFHPSLKKIVAMASEDGIKVHNLFKRPALTSFVRGVTAVLGDAAHVMLPTHGAGGGIAIESAASLEVLFSRVDGRNGAMVQQRLAVFDKLRIPRCNLTMLASNGGPEWRQIPGVVEEIRRFYSGPLPPAGLLQYNKPFREIFFCHDEFRAAEQALAQLNQAPSSSGLASAEAEHDRPGAAPTP
jgi:salicylate hydroxylase